MNELFLYLFAVGVKRFGLHVHALTVMSTHYHAVVTDAGDVGEEGGARAEGRNIPAFEQWLHSLLARSVNHLRGRGDTFWGSRSGGRQRIMDAASVERALVYVMNNPTAAGLVARGRDWPGVRSNPQDMLRADRGRPLVIRRPEGFFGGSRSMPEVVELTFSVPKMLLEREELLVRGGGESAEGSEGSVRGGAVAAGGSLAGRVVGRITEALSVAEGAARERMREAGRRFVGARSILRQSPDVATEAPEEHGARLTRIPLFLVSGEGELANLLQELRVWRDRYRVARAALCEVWEGVRDLVRSSRDALRDATEALLAGVTFPYGTYQLRLHVGVPCAPPPD